MPPVPNTSPARFGRLVALNLAVAAGWFGASELARIQEYAPHASLWFPPAGLGFAVGLTLGWNGLPGILAASIGVSLVELFRHTPHSATVLLGFSVAFGLAHGLSYVGAARLLLRWSSGKPSPGTIGGFLVLAPLSSLAATIGGLASLLAVGLISGIDEAVPLLLPWWIGDFVGVVALGPFFAVLLASLLSRVGTAPPEFFASHRMAAPLERSLGGFVLKLATCLLPLAASVTLLRIWPEQASLASFLVFFAIIPLHWVTHTEGAVRTYAAAAILSVSIAAAGAFLGPGSHALTFQFAALVLCGSAYFGLSLPLLYADNRELRRRLTTDPVTSAATRATFLEAIERELDRAKRFGTPASLVTFDVDHFKQVNDAYGHPFGDQVLATVADRCRRAMRSSDLLGRLGGDEFGILLPMTGLDSAREAAERMAAAFRDDPVVRAHRRETVTASFGVAEIDAARDSVDSALERADLALYEAKRGGRDRVSASIRPPAD